MARPLLGSQAGRAPPSEQARKLALSERVGLGSGGWPQGRVRAGCEPGRTLSASWRRDWDDEPAEAAAEAQLGSVGGPLWAAGHFEHAGLRPGGTS